MKLSEIIKAVIANPEDLSTLPQAAELAQALELEIDTQAEQIGTLQENYRKVLKMVPIPGNEPEPEPEPEPDYSPEAAVNEILEGLKEE